MDTIDTAEAFRGAATAREGLAANALAGSVLAAVEALRGVPTEVAEYRALDESLLVELTTLTAEATRLTSTHAALLAGEIARRSAPELGSQGMAQRAGHRTAEQFVKITTGGTGRQATTAVRTGVLLGQIADDGSLDPATGEVAGLSQPWLRPLGVMVQSGAVSAEASEVIGAGLGVPNSAFTAVQLEALAVELAEAARVRLDGSAGLDVDRLAKLARMRREELDLDSVRLREDEQYAARGMKILEFATGAGRLILDLDPENLLLTKDLFSRAASPKLRTVRFFDPADKIKADRILTDDRTPAQLGFDAFMQLLLLGAGANPDFLLGSGAPQIRVTTTLKALQAGDGIVRVEGSSVLLSMRTLKRMQCTGGVKALLFDESLQPLDIGREQRLFTAAQRTALAVKWGGCAAPGCDAPVSWTEAHHIDEWVANHGKTNVADGILLCKHHHLLFHNNKWHITRDSKAGGGSGSGEYWLVPPPGVDPDQIPRLLQPKTRNMHDLREADDMTEHVALGERRRQ